MPKPTFHNLPADKRDRLVELAIEEFAAHPYRQASLSRIVARAGIAKGSVYQYFDNKLDLYTWLLTDELPRRKMAAIAAAPAGDSLWDVLRAAFLAGCAFAREQPQLARLGGRFRGESGDPELAPIVAAHNAASHGWMRAQLEHGQTTGDVLPGLDLDVAATLLVTTLGEGMLPVFARRIGTTVDAWMADPSLADSLSDDDLAALVDAALGLLRGGFAPPPESP